MKNFTLVALLGVIGLLVGCGPAVSQARQKVAPGESGLDPEPKIIVAATHTPTARPTRTLPTSPTPAPLTPTPIPVEPTSTPAPAPPATSPPATATPPLADTPAPVSPQAATNRPAKEGLQLYREQGCGNCHQLDAAGAQGMVGPTHNGIATTAEERLQAPDYTGAATTPAEYIRESIVNPPAYLVPGYDSPRQKMVAFTNLSETEVEALVQFLLEQK